MLGPTDALTRYRLGGAQDPGLPPGSHQATQGILSWYASYLGMPATREPATAIEAISAGGSHTPAFLIPTGAVHQSTVYRIPELHDDAAIAVSNSGYANDELSLQWLKHFDKHTVQKTTGNTDYLSSIGVARVTGRLRHPLAATTVLWLQIWINSSYGTYRESLDSDVVHFIRYFIG